MSNYQMAVIENIVIYIIVAVLFYVTGSAWSLVFLVFVNIVRRSNKACTGQEPAVEPEK